MQALLFLLQGAAPVLAHTRAFLRITRLFYLLLIEILKAAWATLIVLYTLLDGSTLIFRTIGTHDILMKES